MDIFWTSGVFSFILKCVLCSGTATKWTYGGAVGQSEWNEFFPECGGSSQSPINVDTSEIQHDPTLIPVEPLGYNHPGKKPFILSNNGHTVQMTLPNWMGIGGLPWHYRTVQLHLHWGNGMGMATGSEHTINGQSASAELHIVHYNTEVYANISEAMTQKNGLAVLGILIEVDKEVNQAYGSIFNYLGRIRFAGQKVAIPSFDVQSLLPVNLNHYFRYNGSLTTPPCHQSVLWTIFRESVKISQSQLIKLETVLYSSQAEEEVMALQNNYRTTQPLNHRTVLSSFIPGIKVKLYTAGEIAAVVVGSLCGCIGLTVIICFIVKTIRTQGKPKEHKQDVDLKVSEPEKSKDASCSPQRET
ncbi:hypothetical protein DNTS_006038 [Danionella cerebrum]|uniref:carbonic anhydrase n=1 Tax=Danionella cerebrum TaxID=2873325 RepID=A0A553Q060_9TELE|nr:hypothetical protein DNTS_006038 [Danionella translucida]